MELGKRKYWYVVCYFDTDHPEDMPALYYYAKAGEAVKVARNFGRKDYYAYHVEVRQLDYGKNYNNDGKLVYRRRKMR